MYKKAVASFWSVEEVDLSQDARDWERLSGMNVQPVESQRTQHLALPWQTSAYTSLKLYLLLQVTRSTSSLMCWLSLLHQMALSWRI